MKWNTDGIDLRVDHTVLMWVNDNEPIHKTHGPPIEPLQRDKDGTLIRGEEYET